MLDNMDALLKTNLLAQVGFLVNDLAATKAKFAQFFGVPVPPDVDSGDFAITQTEYRGQPAPDASCKMAFFDVGPGIRIELIEPGPAPSTWRDYLNEHGEGMHHLAFRVKGMQDSINACTAFGMTLEQRGEYNTGGGRYAYMDATKDLKVVLELLEND